MYSPNQTTNWKIQILKKQLAKPVRIGQKIHASFFHMLVDWNNAKFLVNLSALSLKSGHLAKLQKNQNCLAWRTPPRRAPKWPWIMDPKVIWNRSRITNLKNVQSLNFKLLISILVRPVRYRKTIYIYHLIINIQSLKFCWFCSLRYIPYLVKKVLTYHYNTCLYHIYVIVLLNPSIKLW